MRRRLTLTSLCALALAGCVGQRSALPSPRPTPASPATAPAPPLSVKAARAVEAGLTLGPDFDRLGVSPEAAVRALGAFRLSCPAAQRRSDGSGLTRGVDWQLACAAAQTTPDEEARDFFRRAFEVVKVSDGQAFATGYYEPEIAAARDCQPGYEVPIYQRPNDIVEVDLSLFSDQFKGRRIRGRVKGNQLIPYADRAEIENGWLMGRGLELACAADPVELFFLQVQGSGRLRLPDGSVMRIGYDGQNGRDYTAIGKVMRERGLLAPGQANMEGIMAWLRADPAAGRAMMQENKSWVFFKEIRGAGPLGALNVPVTGKATVAADPLFVPLGAPVVLKMDRAEANGLWIAQDTGGAIKGANRFDTFWGAGQDARTIAGGMAAKGQAYILLPKGSLARLEGETGRAVPSSQR